MSNNPYNTPLPPAQATEAGRMRTLQIMEIDVFSLELLNGAIGVCIGLVVGAVFAAVSIFGSAAGGNPVAGLLFAVAAIVLIPAMHGLAAFVSGCIGAILYNFIAAIVGGVRIRVE